MSNLIIISDSASLDALNDKIQLLEQENEALRKEKDNMLEIMLKMRKYQIEYKAYHIASDRDRMNHWQRKCDALLKDKLQGQRSGQLKAF